MLSVADPAKEGRQAVGEAHGKRQAAASGSRQAAVGEGDTSHQGTQYGARGGARAGSHAGGEAGAEAAGEGSSEGQKEAANTCGAAAKEAAANAGVVVLYTNAWSLSYRLSAVGVNGKWVVLTEVVMQLCTDLIFRASWSICLS